MSISLEVQFPQIEILSREHDEKRLIPEGYTGIDIRLFWIEFFFNPSWSWWPKKLRFAPSFTLFDLEYRSNFKKGGRTYLKICNITLCNLDCS